VILKVCNNFIAECFVSFLNYSTVINEEVRKGAIDERQREAFSDPFFIFYTISYKEIITMHYKQWTIPTAPMLFDLAR
jgi:hypothetical protein